MLEELTKRVESDEKKIEANDKKVENYNLRIDQIPGVPPVLKGPDSKKFVQIPFPPSAAPMKIPKRFRMPDIPKYNGTTDLNEHVTAYIFAIKCNDLADDERESVLLKKFGETLSKGVMIWYHNLPEHSIDSFAMLADAFVKAHVGAIKVETRKSDLFNVKQRDDETLHEFVVLFQMERMDLPGSADDWAVRGFYSGSTRSSITYGAKAKSIECPTIAWVITPVNREIPRLFEYNFCIDVVTIAAAVIRNRETKHPRPIQSDPEKRDKSLICKYHHTHIHRTEDCRQLREEVACLFNLGHLREFLSERAKTHFKNVDANKQDRSEEPQQVVHMIMGGMDVPRGPVVKRTKVSITREKRIWNYDPDGPISFSDEDMEGSSATIIRWRVIEQLGLLDQIMPAIRVLNGFNMACETTKGEINLPINTTGTTQQTKFYVIEGDMGYNALLGRPWIHLMKVSLSTMHQALKFSTSEGIKTVHGEQQAAKKMFAVEKSVTTTMMPEWNEGESAK
ncbi:uncharacterized protein LOC132034979 [Lycium ferocissimum]|uniref:uncharacterized protein LOC132034979 n=1 Tax=Lycium ferocissimum TaxID=112874 RepID=UPI002815C29E|nr:uncharacterized protein LOC132034979 [Lycium ferocissimum]